MNQPSRSAFRRFLNDDGNQHLYVRPSAVIAVERNDSFGSRDVSTIMLAGGLTVSVCGTPFEVMLALGFEWSGAPEPEENSE